MAFFFVIGNFVPNLLKAQTKTVFTIVHLLNLVSCFILASASMQNDLKNVYVSKIEASMSWEEEIYYS